MVSRWRTISSGFYDYTIERYVKPMNKLQAALQTNRRHLEVTGVDQKIVIKSLDDYFAQIVCGSKAEHPFDFESNKHRMINVLRKHCAEARKVEKMEKE